MLVSDIVGPNETLYYKLEIDDFMYQLLDKNDLSMDIHPYSGNPDLFITPSP